MRAANVHCERRLGLEVGNFMAAFPDAGETEFAGLSYLAVILSRRPRVWRSQLS